MYENGMIVCHVLFEAGDVAIPPLPNRKPLSRDCDRDPSQLREPVSLLPCHLGLCWPWHGGQCNRPWLVFRFPTVVTHNLVLLNVALGALVGAVAAAGALALQLFQKRLLVLVSAAPLAQLLLLACGGA